MDERSGRPGAVTVAIPVLDGERYLDQVIDAVRDQELDRPVELLVLDSGSRDRSVEISRRRGARVVEIEQESFSHGGTRNRMMELAAGDHVAFLTQDATPAHSRWLSNLLSGFELAEDVALVFGPYIPRREASHMMARELREFFSSFAPDGQPIVQRLPESERARYRRSPSALTFFSDANGCVARWAWERVPYRDAGYAEDQLLAAEMIEAGYAKVFHPDAGAYHSHEYGPLTYFRRCFDEWRGLREVYGHVENASAKRVARRLLDEIRADDEYLRAGGASGAPRARGAARSVLHHAVRMSGAIAGSRAERLPARLRSWLSLEGRAGFSPHPRPPTGSPAGRSAGRSVGH